MNDTRLEVVDPFRRPLDKAYFPSGLKRDPDVSPTAKMAAGLLFSPCDDKFAVAQLHRTHQVDEPPTQDEIAEWLGVSPRLVRYAFAELKSAGYLVVKKRRTGRPRYLFRAPQMALNLDQDRQPAAGPAAVKTGNPLPVRTGNHVPNTEPQDRQPVAGPDRQPCAEHPYIVRSFVYINNDERARSLVVALLKKEELTDGQIADVLAVRTDAEICAQVEAMAFRKYTVRAAVLLEALMKPYALPAKYLAKKAQEERNLRQERERQYAADLEKARLQDAQLALQPADELKRRRPNAEERRAALPETMRRRLAEGA